jgi:hypothetical protein
MAKGVSVGSAIGDFLSIGIMLATGIVWLLIGADNVHLVCLDNSYHWGTPNVDTWLIVEGAFLIGWSCISILLFPCKHIHKVRKNFPGAKLLLWANNIWGLIAALFHLAWLIVGAVQLSKCTLLAPFFFFLSFLVSFIPANFLHFLLILALLAD